MKCANLWKPEKWTLYIKESLVLPQTEVYEGLDLEEIADGAYTVHLWLRFRDQSRAMHGEDFAAVGYAM